MRALLQPAVMALPPVLGTGAVAAAVAVNATSLTVEFRAI